MTNGTRWFKVSGDFMRHPKVRKLTRTYAPGLGLWLSAGSSCADAFEGGVIGSDMLADAVQDAGLTVSAGTKATAALVQVGLWHNAKTIRGCGDCLHAADGRLAPGSHYVHDWLAYNFTKDEAKIPAERFKAMRLKRLHRNPDLKLVILDRDGEHCRYCGIRVDYRARVGDNAGTYDHIDPNLRTGEQKDGNTKDNVVVSCAPCNCSKGNRTPEEWVAECGPWSLTNPGGGRLLLPEPDLAGARSGPDRGQADG